MLFQIEMSLEYPDGHRVDIVLLRDQQWLELHNAEAGEILFVDLPEQGVRGWADILAVESKLVPTQPDGRMVTGTFCHSNGLPGDLVVTSEPEPIGVTASHLFWSVDRQSWVPVSEVKKGETVKTLGGYGHVVSYTMRDRCEKVYNLEVEEDHVYRVGQSGVLVHNTSAPGCVNNRSGSVDYGDFDNWGVEPATSDHYAGRPEGVHAFITPNHGMGSGAQSYLVPPGWNDLPMGILRARGHLLGRQLGGSGREPLNIVALHRVANSPAMVTCENRIVDALNCECVDVWITPIYNHNSGAPEAVRIRAIGDRNIFRLDVRIENVANAQTPSMCVPSTNSS